MRGEQQVVVMETGKIVTRLTSTALMGWGVVVMGVGEVWMLG